MATSFPGALDTFTNPTGGQVQGSTTPTHASHHANHNDAIETLEAKLGTGSSTPSANTVLRGTGPGASAFGQIVAADIANDTITATQLATDSVGALELADNAVVNVNVAAGAAIALAKLAPGASGVLKSNGTAISAGNQIVTGDLAAHAISQMQVVYGATANPSTTATTSGAAPVLAEMTITMTTTGGDLFILFSSPFRHGSPTVQGVCDLFIDGSLWEERSWYFHAANAEVLVAMNLGLLGPDLPGGAASHTFTIRFWTSTGTITALGGVRTFTVCELKR